MKLTKEFLFNLIQEAIDHEGLNCNEVHPEHTHSEWEEHKKEEEVKTKAMAKISIKPSKKIPNKLSENFPMSIPKAKVEKLYTSWKPTTDESKLYKKQLGKVLEK